MKEHGKFISCCRLTTPSATVKTNHDVATCPHLLKPESFHPAERKLALANCGRPAAPRKFEWIESDQLKVAFCQRLTTWNSSHAMGTVFDPINDSTDLVLCNYFLPLASPLRISESCCGHFDIFFEGLPSGYGPLIRNGRFDLSSLFPLFCPLYGNLSRNLNLPNFQAPEIFCKTRPMASPRRKWPNSTGHEPGHAEFAFKHIFYQGHNRLDSRSVIWVNGVPGNSRC